MAKYRWKDGSRLKVDAQAVGEEIERLRESGPITTDRIVNEAKRGSSPLHGAFTWNVQTAAAERWSDQARYLLRSLIVVEVKNVATPPTRALIHLGPLDDEDSAIDAQYHYVPDALQNGAVRSALLSNAKRDARVFRRNYEVLKEMASVIDAIDSALAA